MSLPRWPRALSLALAAAAVVRLASTVGPLGAEAFQKGACWPETDNAVESGAALLLGVPYAYARPMPGWSVTNALLCQGEARSRVALGRGLALFLCGLLVFCLGWLLHSPLCGALALLAFSFLAPDWFVGRRWLCIPLASLAACLAAWRARAPSLKRTWLAAGALAANLAVISTLFLFGPVLALHDWASGGGERRRRARAVSAAVLCLAPLLFLAPWVYMNWRAYGSLTLFERGRADSNILNGALGLVECPPFDRLPPPGEGVLGRAAAEVASHPLRYLAACGRRLWFSFSLQPLLACAGLLALAVLRRREEVRAVGLLALYWVAVHCLMTVERDYFIPVWPLFLVLGAGLAAHLLRLPRDSPGDRFAAVAAGGGLAAGLGLTAFALGLAAAYPARSSRPEALDAALRRSPGQAWLWAERGARRLEARQGLAAAADYEAALRLDPQREYEVRAAWAAAAGGRLDRPLQVLTEAPDKRELRAAIVETLRRLLRREAGPARRAWGEALDMTSRLQRRESGSPLDAAGREGLRETVREVLLPWPEREKPRLLRDLSRFLDREVPAR
ncbi:MAG: hypothetical protein HY926_10975 [Elusimicrobia bacterium]|nr:hypothetical protein [Elusimicrobiota bacterium]